MDRRAALIWSAALLGVLVLVVAVALTGSRDPEPGVEPSAAPSESASPQPSSSDSPMSTAMITGRIVPVADGEDDAFHLVVDGLGALPIRITAGLDAVTGVEVTVTVRVPASLEVSGSLTERFRALESYAMSERGAIIEVIEID